MTTAVHRGCYPPAGLTRVNDALALLAASVAMAAQSHGLVWLDENTIEITADDLLFARSMAS